jgi:tRNA modification GTPase
MCDQITCEPSQVIFIKVRKMLEDTIAAIATPLGEGGIGIVRISGEETLKILDKVFISRSKNDPQKNNTKKNNPPTFENRKLLYGNIIDKKNNEIIDEVLITFMNSESSYTREDVGEIYCHGSVIALKKTLELVLRSGARLAERGEFTKRGFLNGRIDLAQAEAVIDLIKAKTDKGYSIALAQLDGGLSLKISSIRDSILEILAHIIVNIDYPDSDVEDISYKYLEDSLSSIEDAVNELLSTCDAGRIIKEGLSTAIIGKPNVGKSSLMNALLRENRAIVTEIPGTTRDTIEEIINVHGIPIKLIDTAGIRETHDEIEKIGIKKSKESYEKADLIILVLNASAKVSEEDLFIIEQIKSKKTIVLLNKIDLGQELPNEYINGLLPDAQIIRSTINKGVGLKELEEAIVDYVFSGKVKQDDSLLITNTRHKLLLEGARDSVRDAIEMTKKKEALDFIEVDIKKAWELLGEIIGETISENIIDEVFSRFCLGK